MAPKKRTLQATETGETTTGAYSANFEQIMNDENMKFSWRNDPSQRPRNYDEIKERLGKERVCDSEHQAHGVLDDLNDTLTHNDLVNSMMPILHGTKFHGTPLPGRQNRQFTVMKPGDIITAKVKRFAPDYYEGVKSNIVDKDLRKNLRTSIIPSNYNEDPIAPNFFLEFVLESGSSVVTRRQAGIDGVLGARCMNSLQNYPRKMSDKGPPPNGWEFDCNAYSFGLTYRPRDLTIYSIHMTPPEPLDKQPGYRIVQIEIYSLVREDSYHEAISAYRNIRDLAQEYRDRIVTEASSRAAQLRAPIFSPAPEHPSRSEAGGIGSSQRREKTAASTEDDGGSSIPPEVRATSTEGPGNEQQDVVSSVDSEEQEDEQHDEYPGSGRQPVADNTTMSFNVTPSLDDPPDWNSRLRRPRQPKEDTNYQPPSKRRRRGGRGAQEIQTADEVGDSSKKRVKRTS